MLRLLWVYAPALAWTLEPGLRDRRLRGLYLIVRTSGRVCLGDEVVVLRPVDSGQLKLNGASYEAWSLAAWKEGSDTCGVFDGSSVLLWAIFREG